MGEHGKKGGEDSLMGLGGGVCDRSVIREGPSPVTCSSELLEHQN